MRMGRVCSQCGAVINQYHPGDLCFPCQEKRLEEKITSVEDIIDAEDFADILGYNNAESIRRLGREGKLPDRVPENKKWLWYKDVVDDWIKQKGRTGNRDFRMTARGIASNLRRCSNDSVIYCFSDTIESRVYGEETILGTTDTGRVEPITLAKVDRTVALKLLEQLPKEEFPELIGITDWSDLPYDRVNEDLIVRLEAYF